MFPSASVPSVPNCAVSREANKNIDEDGRCHAAPAPFFVINIFRSYSPGFPESPPACLLPRRGRRSRGSAGLPYCTLALKPFRRFGVELPQLVVDARVSRHGRAHIDADGRCVNELDVRDALGANSTLLLNCYSIAYPGMHFHNGHR